MRKDSKKDVELTQEQKDFQAEQRRIIKENLAEWEKQKRGQTRILVIRRNKGVRLLEIGTFLKKTRF